MGELKRVPDPERAKSECAVPQCDQNKFSIWEIRVYNNYLGTCFHEGTAGRESGENVTHFIHSIQGSIITNGLNSYGLFTKILKS